MINLTYLEYRIEHTLSCNPQASMSLHAFADLHDAASIMENLKKDIIKTSAIPDKMQLSVCQNRFVRSYETLQFSCESIDSIIRWFRKCSDRYKVYIETSYEYQADRLARAASNIKEYSARQQGRYVRCTDDYWPYPVIKKIYAAPVPEHMFERFDHYSLTARGFLNKYAGISAVPRTRVQQFRLMDRMIFGNDYDIRDILEWDEVLYDFIDTYLSVARHNPDIPDNIRPNCTRLSKKSGRSDIRDMINNSFSYQCISNDSNGLVPITADIIYSIDPHSGRMWIPHSGYPKIPVIFKHMPPDLDIGEILQNNLFFTDSKDILLFYDDYRERFSRCFNFLI